MATLILIDHGKAYASSDDKKMIRNWKRCADISKVPITVLVDNVDENGQGTYTIAVPLFYAKRTVALLIPKIPELTEEERNAALEKIEKAKMYFGGGKESWQAVP